MRKIILAAAAVVLAASGLARAVPITYTETATGAGILDGVPFGNQSITIVCTADTSNITNSSSVFKNTGSVATVTIGGITTDTFTDSFGVFDNQGLNIPAVGIQDLGQSPSRDVLDTLNTAFGAYDLSTSIGPLSGTPEINSIFTFPTTFGGLEITSISGTSTFTATVPEPASLGVIGLLSTVGLIRRRRDPMR